MQDIEPHPHHSVQGKLSLESLSHESFIWASTQKTLGGWILSYDMDIRFNCRAIPDDCLVISPLEGTLRIWNIHEDDDFVFDKYKKEYMWQHRRHSAWEDVLPCEEEAFYELAACFVSHVLTALRRRCGISRFTG